MTATRILGRVGWKTSVVLGLFLSLYLAATVGLFFYGLEAWLLAVNVVCDLILWVVAVLYCVGEAEIVPIELGLLLFLSLLGPVGLVVVISAIVKS